MAHTGSKTVTIQVLGSGNSNGVPMAGNDWGKCDPNEPKNYRTRPSLWIHTENTSLIVDTGPDFREQTNRASIKHIDAILYTHAHSDHIDGMNDLRPYWRRQGLATAGQQIPVYSDKYTLDEMCLRFDYLFTSKSPLYPEMLKRQIISEDQLGTPMMIGDIVLTLFWQDHGPDARSLGFRIGDFGYSTDMADLDNAAIKVLSGVKNWVADGANYNFPTVLVHANKQRLIELQAKIKPQNLYLTHLPCTLDYKEISAELPDGMFMAYDGLEFTTSL